MRMISPRLLLGLGAALIVCAAATGAMADDKYGAILGTTMVTVQVYQNNELVGEHTWGNLQTGQGVTYNGSEVSWSPGWSSQGSGYSILASLQLTKGAPGNEVNYGEVGGTNCVINLDPAVNLNFAVDAGFVDTTFVFNSAVVGSFSLTNPYAYAGATVSISDGDGDGAALTGNLGGYAYEAYTNLGSYKKHNASFTSPSWDAASSSGNYTAPISGTVTTMWTKFSFTLSANDSASGTSAFVISDQVIPEPASFVALFSGLVGFGAVIRRKK